MFSNYSSRGLVIYVYVACITCYVFLTEPVNRQTGKPVFLPRTYRCKGATAHEALSYPYYTTADEANILKTIEDQIPHEYSWIFLKIYFCAAKKSTDTTTRPFLSSLHQLLGIMDRDYMHEPRKKNKQPYKKPPTIVIVGAILALISFGFLALCR